MVTPADLTGSGAAAASISSLIGLASTAPREVTWIQFVISGSGSVRVGDPNTSSSRGLPIPAGGGLLLSRSARGLAEQGYNLDNVWLYIPSGATVSLAYHY